MNTYIKTEVTKNKQVTFKRLVVVLGKYDTRMYCYVSVIKKTGKVVLYVWNDKRYAYNKTIVLE